MPVFWREALIAAGAVPAAFVPEASLGRNDLTTVTGADLVEGARLRAIPVGPAAVPPGDRTAACSPWPTPRGNSG